MPVRVSVLRAYTRAEAFAGFSNRCYIRESNDTRQAAPAHIASALGLRVSALGLRVSAESMAYMAMACESLLRLWPI